MSKARKAIAIVSGGMDSVTLAYLLKAQEFDATKILSFDYGQKHVKELECAKQAADDLGFVHHIIDLTSITHLLTGSALTDSRVDVPEGHYAAESMKDTVVPNRNAMMLSIAWAVGIADKAELVAAGMHAGDHPIYPDCRPQFITALGNALTIGNQGFGRPEGMELWTPFIYGDKTRIAKHAKELGVPLEKTWSCYKGGDLHCGKCGTCVERIEAIEGAGIEDPTIYSREFGQRSAPE